MLKGVLNDHEFNSNDATEGAITKVLHELFFYGVQGTFHSWMSRPAWAIENGESRSLNKYEMVSSHGMNLKIVGGGDFLYALDFIALIDQTETPNAVSRFVLVLDSLHVAGNLFGYVCDRERDGEEFLLSSFGK
jgi:hypothetical protein